MKNIMLLLTLLVTLLGCAERYDGDVNFLDCPDTDDADNGDPPRIVNTDPPRERIAPDLLLNDAYPPSVIKLDPEEFQTITVTFSSPPRNLRVTLGPRYALDYALLKVHKLR